MSKVYYVLARKISYRYYTGEDFSESLAGTSSLSKKPVMKFVSIAEALKFLAKTEDRNAPYVEQIIRVEETPVPEPKVTYKEVEVK